MEKVRIFVASHKPGLKYAEVPIYVGRAISKYKAEMEDLIKVNPKMH